MEITYTSHSKDLIDHLFTIGDALSNRVQVLYMLGELDGGYKSPMITITNKKMVLSLDELFTRMRIYDMKMKCMNMPHTHSNYSITKPTSQKP